MTVGKGNTLPRSVAVRKWDTLPRSVTVGKGDTAQECDSGKGNTLFKSHVEREVG